MFLCMLSLHLNLIPTMNMSSVKRKNQASKINMPRDTHERKAISHNHESSPSKVPYHGSMLFAKAGYIPVQQDKNQNRFSYWEKK